MLNPLRPDALPIIPTPYLMSLKDTLVSPAIDAYVYHHFQKMVPWPGAAATRAYCEWFGHSSAATRTALSRAKSQQHIHIEGSPPRIILGNTLKHQVNYYLRENFSDSSFSLIITHFSQDSDSERYRVKDLLTRLGYVKFTHNTYLRYGSNPAPVLEWLHQQELSQYVYHFHPLEDIPHTLQSELASLYELAKWRTVLKDYSDFLTAFLKQTDLKSLEGYLSYLYVRSAFHKNIMTCAPFLPPRYFAEVTLLKDCYERLGTLAHTHMNSNLEHYCTFFGAD